MDNGTSFRRSVLLADRKLPGSIPGLTVCAGVCCVFSGLARDQVPVHHRGSPSGHHGPDPPPGVQQGQLEAGTALGVKVSDVGFLGDSREM